MFCWESNWYFWFRLFYSALRPLSSFRFTPADLEDWTVNAELTTDGEGRVGIGDAGTAQEETLFSTVALDLPAGFYRITVNYRAEAWFDEKGTLTLPSLSLLHRGKIRGLHLRRFAESR